MSTSPDSSLDKEAQKEEARKSRDLRDAGRVPRWRNFHLDAGRRVRTAWAWIPRLRWITLLASLVAIAACLASIAAVYSRPGAMVFLSLADGTIACAPLSTPQGQPIARPRSQQAVCDRLVPPVGFADDQPATAKGNP